MNRVTGKRDTFTAEKLLRRLSLLWGLSFCLFFLGSCLDVPTQTSGATSTSSSQSSSVDFLAMDTYMMVTVYGSEADQATKAVEALIYELENTLARERADSEISQINRQAGLSSVPVSEETFALIQKALEISAATEGAFDITIAPLMDLWGFSSGDFRVPTESEIAAVLPLVGWEKVKLDPESRGVFLPLPGMELDLGGIGKGYASDRAQEELANFTLSGASLSLGGNAATWGQKPDGSPWRIAISDPNSAADYLGILEAQDTSVITSGSYERFFEQNGHKYSHIMVPSQGVPVENDLLSVSIVRPEGIWGDALSTALFVMGKDSAIRFWKKYQDFSMVLVTKDNTVWLTPDLKSTFTLSNQNYELVFIDE